MFKQVIEYVDVEVTLPTPVKKMVWDFEEQEFLPMLLYKHKGVPGTEQMAWLYKTYGPEGTYKNGRYWDYTRAGNYTIMDEKVYTWYQMKWGNK